MPAKARVRNRISREHTNTPALVESWKEHSITHRGWHWEPHEPWQLWQETEVPWQTAPVWQLPEQEFASVDSCWDVVGSRSGVNPAVMISTRVKVKPGKHLFGKSRSYSNWQFNWPYCFRTNITVDRQIEWTPDIIVGTGHQYSGPGSAICDPSKLQGLVGAHETACLGPLRSRSLDLTNFTIELADVKRLWTLIRSKHWTIIQKVVSGTFSWEFGIKPFLSDIARMQHALDNVLDMLKRTPRGPARLRVKTNYSDLDADLGSIRLPQEQTRISGNWKEVNTWEYDVGACNAKAWAVSWITVDYSALNEAQRLIVASLCEFGLTNLPNTIWNLTPYSFIVDWFFNVQSVIRLLDMVPLIVRPTVRDTTYHYLEEVCGRCNSRIEELTSFDPITAEVSLTATMKSRGYQRWVGPPTGTLQYRTPGSRELMLTALLAGQYEGWVRELSELERSLKRLYRKYLRALRRGRKGKPRLR